MFVEALCVRGSSMYVGVMVATIESKKWLLIVNCVQGPAYNINLSDKSTSSTLRASEFLRRER